MKKTISAVVAIALALLLFTSAFASTSVSIGNSGLSISLPSDYEEFELTDEDIEESMVGYWYNDDIDIAFYLYDAEGCSLETLADEYIDDTDVIESGYCTNKYAGLPFAYIAYEYTDNGDTYYVLEFYTVLNDSFVDIVIYMPDSGYSRDVYALMETLSRSGAVVTSGSITSQIQNNLSDGGEISIGTTGYSITIPSDYTQYPLDDEDVSKGLVDYWYNDDLDLGIYVTDADGYTLKEYVNSYAEDVESDRYGTNAVINGIQFGYVASQQTEDGETITEINYITIQDNKIIEIVFWMYEDASYEASQIMLTLR